MSIPRIYTEQTITTGKPVEICGQPAQHIVQVLRLRTGAALRIFNGSGQEWEAILECTGRNQVTLRPGKSLDGTSESTLDICLVQGIARNDRMDLILQKAVELGINSIQPLWTQRSQSHLKGDRLEKRQQHWQGIVISACEQCGRTTLPVLHATQTYPDWIQQKSDAALRLMLQPGSTCTLPGLPHPDGRIELLVGPEGGLNPDEQLFAQGNGFTGLRLGQRILRTETAALAAIAGMQMIWGDFRQLRD